MKKDNEPLVNNVRALPPKNMSVIEAARYSTLSERYIRNLLAERKLPAIRVGSRVVIRLVDLDRFLESKLESAG